jgi:plastocyanin
MVVTGVGELVATPGGAQSVSLMRFMQPNVRIHVGETVEWDSSDVSGHSVTFGPEPAGGYTPLSPKTANVLTDTDGGLHAFISGDTDVVHSGRLAPASQERTNLAQSAPGPTRFRATFTQPGTYHYICAFHDELGMIGEVIVLP